MFIIRFEQLGGIQKIRNISDNINETLMNIHDSHLKDIYDRIDIILDEAFEI